MRQCTHGDQINARVRDRPHVRQCDTAGCLDDRTPADRLDRATNIIDAHVVEQDDVRRSVECIRQLIERRHFDFNA